MKRTDLEKQKGLSLQGRMKQAQTPERFGKEAAVSLSRREQRRLDKERGLVPFAVKVDGELVKQIQALAGERATDLNELTADLLRKGLESLAAAS
jgi:hypothetical protein